MTSKTSAYGLLLIATAAGTAGCAGRNTVGPEHPSYTVSRSVGEQLKGIGAQLEAQDWTGALAALQDVEANNELNPYEQALVWQMRGGAHLGQENAAEGAKDLERAVALHAMPEQEQQNVTFSLGHTYLVLERIPEAAKTLEGWVQSAKDPNPEELTVVASALAREKRFEDALPHAKRAVERMDPPSEAALRLLVSIYYELDRQKDVAAVLTELTERYPDSKEWWLQLAATYGALGDQDQALAVLKKAADKGFLTAERELLAFAHAYLKSGQPEQAAALIEEQIAAGKLSKAQGSLELLASSWLAAKNADKAEAALATAGDALTSGEPYVALAKLEIARGQWAKARDALASAFAKGGLRAPGEAHLLLGAAHYHTKRKDAAQASLTEAKRDKATERCAEVWLQIVRTGKEGSEAACLNASEKP